MKRSRTITSRSVAAVMLLLTVLTGFVVPCMCADPPSKPGGHAVSTVSDHSCCNEKPGLQPAHASCCADHDKATASATWTPAATVVVTDAGTHVVVAVSSLASIVPLSLPPQRPVSASPPLRI